MNIGDLVKLLTPEGSVVGLIVRVITDIDPAQDLYAVQWTGRYNGETSLVTGDEIEVVI